MDPKVCRGSPRLPRRLCALVLLWSLCPVAVSTEDNVTATPTEVATTLSTTGRTEATDVIVTSSVVTPEGTIGALNATDAFTSPGQGNASDVMVTSSLFTTPATVNESSTEIAAELNNVTLSGALNVTEMLGSNATDAFTSPGQGNTSDVTVTSSPFTTPATENETESVTEMTTKFGNVTVSEGLTEGIGGENVTQLVETTGGNATTELTDTSSSTETSTAEGHYANDTASSGHGNSSLPTADGTAAPTHALEEITTELIPVGLATSPGSPTQFVRLTHTSYAIPILIFGALLFLLMIMIFIVVITKPSRIKRTISTYNLTASEQLQRPGASERVGYRNTAYAHGDLADDTDVECSMQEMRLNGKTTNGDGPKNPRGLEEELTAL